MAELNIFLKKKALSLQSLYSYMYLNLFIYSNAVKLVLALQG
jgi:hypothetical protein